MEKFSDIKYVRVDVNQMKKQFVKSIKQFNTAKNFQTAENALLDVQRIEKELYTTTTIAHIRHDINMADKFYEDEVKYYNGQMAMLMPVMKKLSKSIVNTKFRKEFEAKYGNMLFLCNEADIKLQSLKIIFDMIKENNLSMQYSKTVAMKKCQFNGKECNFYGLLKFMESSDREIRKAAFEQWAQMYSEVAPELDEIYTKLVKLRTKEAKKLGFSSYTPMAYLSKHRFDYDEKDVAVFREQILKVVTPLCDKLLKEQAKRLGVDKIKAYDEKLIFPEGNADPIGTKDEQVACAQKMYREMSKEAGEFFDFMVKYDLFDLETKPNKHMGGYCTIMPQDDYQAPFIFSNFNGTAADYQVLTHEAGHCFNMYLSMRNNKLVETISSTSEVNEIHSMAMELFALPWAKDFFGDKVDKAVYAHLLDSLYNLPYMATVDEFQHEMYANPKLTAMERRAIWRRLEKKYQPWRDYDGNEFLEQGGYWMQKQHIFLYPFYYIDYALAQLGAYEFYGKNKVDHDKAWGEYVELCRAGGNRSYLELLKLGNLSNPFEMGTVEKTVGYILPDLEKAPQ